MNLPVRPRWIVLAAITLWIGGGILFQSPSTGSGDPVEAAIPMSRTKNDVRVLRMVEGPTDLVGCQRHCWFAGTTPSKIVLYEDLSGQSQDIHWSILGQRGTTWHITGFSGRTSRRSPADRDAVLGDSFPMRVPEGTGPIYRWGIANDHLLLIGSADIDAVAHVEVEYDTGQVTRDTPLNDVYVNVAQAEAVCEIRARGFDGEIIERISVNDDEPLQQPNPNRALTLCERT